MQQFSITKLIYLVTIWLQRAKTYKTSLKSLFLTQFVINCAENMIFCVRITKIKILGSRRHNFNLLMLRKNDRRLIFHVYLISN